eukprot:Rhum_TRINITY_DN15063_c2_g1::Rhum_TRINITY_DN15063_c2_g1_i2::g.135607::m.135607
MRQAVLLLALAANAASAALVDCRDQHFCSEQKGYIPKVNGTQCEDDNTKDNWCGHANINTICCDTLCTHDVVSCQDGKKKLSQATNATGTAPAMCGSTPDSCTKAATCCGDYVPLDYRWLNERAFKRACNTDADCRNFGDKKATCYLDKSTSRSTIHTCKCSPGYDVQTSLWGGQPGEKVCYPTHSTRTTTFGIEFTSAHADRICKTFDVEPKAKEELRRRVDTLLKQPKYTVGFLYAASFWCEGAAGAKVFHAGFTVEHTTSSSAIRTAIKDELTKEVAADHYLSEAFQATALTLKTSTCSDTAIAVGVNVGGVGGCRPVYCNKGYYYFQDLTDADDDKVPDKNPECKKIVDNTELKNVCRLHGDCSWEDNLHECTGGKCVAFQQPTLYREPLAMRADFCHDNNDCRSFNDTNATCVMDKGLGNWCSCSDAGYGYLSPQIPFCVTDAKRTEVETKGLEWYFITSVSSAFFGSASGEHACPRRTEEKTAFKALLEKTFGPVTLFRELCTTESTQFAVRIKMSWQQFVKASETAPVALSASTPPQSLYLTNLLRAELDRVQKLRTAHLAALKQLSRSADALETTEDVFVYDALNAYAPGTSYEAIQIGIARECVLSNTTASVITHRDVCQALECSAPYTLVTKDDTSRCIMIPEAPRGVVEQADDDLTFGQRTGIIIGCILFVVVLAVIVLLVTAKPQEAVPVGDDDEEAEMEEEKGEAA